MRQDPLIIVSTGNSGSSALMEVLHACGLFLGQTKQYVMRNHFEHPYFQSVNKALLGGERFPYPRLDEERYPVLKEVLEDEALARHVRENALALMLTEGVQESPWGFKDPRSCITFPFWVRVFPEAKFLFLERHPDAAVGWNARTSDVGYENFRKWFKANLALAEGEGLDHRLVQYSDVNFYQLCRWVGGLSWKKAAKALWKPEALS